MVEQIRTVVVRGRALTPRSMGAGRMFALCTYRGSEKRGVLDRERNKKKAKHRHMVIIEKMSALFSLVL